MEELLKAIAVSTTEEKILLLPQALEQGESGIDYLLECLEDPCLEIRAKAYELLQSVKTDKAKNAIANGLLLNPGESIYYVCTSSMWFDDSFYSLYPSKASDNVCSLSTSEEYANWGYKVVRFEDAAYITTNTKYYLDAAEAELKADLLHRQNITEINITEFHLNDDSELIKQWCDRNNISEAINEYQTEELINQGWDKWSKTYEMPNPWDFIFWSTVEKYLKETQNIKLLSQLWQDLVGKLAFVQQIIFNTKSYLSIDPYYSQIINSSKKVNRYSLGYDEEELSLEELELRMLLTALNNPKLETRILAYQLLHGFDCEQAKQAIHQGVKLNPGDKIYSVYQAGMGFDDQEYYLVEDYVDYAHQIHKLIDIDCYCDPRGLGLRKYCYVDKTQAENATEALHRQLVKNKGYDSEWRKENPDFDLRQWCAENKITYKDEWDKYPDSTFCNLHAIYEVKQIINDNKELRDKFRRSRYIYHPDHMDVWCEDNNIDYQKICSKQNNVKPWEEDWSDYIQILDYLNLPENIELLSKFWKDGVGNYAFLREETVQQAIYVKIGKELNSELGEDKVFAVSKEFEIEARELVINAIEGKKSKVIAQARKIVQQSDWDEIPF